MFEKLAAPYLEFLAQKPHGAVHRVAQHVADGKEARFVVLNDAAVGRQVYLAVGEGVERVDGLVGRYARREVHQNLHLRRRVVVHLACLYLSLVNGFEYGVDERRCGLAVRYLLYGDGLAVYLLYLGAHLELSSALSVVVFAHVYGAACGEVWIEGELLSAKIAYRRVAYLHKVVRQNLRAQTHGYALRSLREQQRKLRRQRDGLAVASVVAQLPVGCLGVEHHVERELRQPRLYVTWCGSPVAGKYVAPVSLTVDEQILLSHLHEGVSYGCVAVRMELHGVSHDVRHLVVPSVVHALHGVQYASLHGLQSVLYVWHGAFEYHV